MAKVRTSLSSVISQAIGGAKFILIELDKDGSPVPVYDAGGELVTFRSGGEAAARAEALGRANPGRKFQPRPVNDNEWRTREAKRVKQGDYLPLPWEKERWWRDLEHIHKDHFPHASVKKEAMLAFTEGDDKGAADIQTRIKPGRYLEKFFGEPGILNKYVIRDLCTQFSTKYEDNLVMWAETAEEIEEVYVSGPASCMSKGSGSYPTKGIHPVRAYVGPDLKVAYIKREGRIVARALINEPQKTYSTIYGDQGRFAPILNKAGYKSGWPNGARMSKIKVPGSTDGQPFALVLPHIDGVGWVKDTGEFLVIGESKASMDENNGIQCQGANGVSELLGYKCARCPCDTLTQRSVVSVFVSERNTQSWCKVCSKKGAFQCPVTGYFVVNEQAVMLADGTKMWQKMFAKEGFVCPGDGLNYRKTEGIKVGAEYWSKKHFKANAETCYCGKTWPRGEGCTTTCKSSGKSMDDLKAGQKAAAKSLYGGTTASTAYYSTIR